jgi:hypothetical protein
MTAPMPDPSPVIDTPARWISYETSGFATMPWRLGSVIAPIPPKDGTPLDVWQRRHEHFRHLIAVEVVGAHGVVRQLAKALRSGERVSLFSNDPAHRYQSITWAGGGLVPFYKHLPSGPTHALFLHPQAVVGELNPENPVYAVNREEDLTHAYRMLNAALPIPVLPAWTAWLLDRGRAANLVFDLEGVGLWALELVPNVGQWAAIVRQGLTTKELRWAS